MLDISCAIDGRMNRKLPMAKTFLRVLAYSCLGIVVMVSVLLTWLRWDAGKPLDQWFEQRQGTLTDVAISAVTDNDGQITELVTLTADSGLSVTLRTIRTAANDEPLPILLVLGGHRTGSDAVDLFGKVGKRAVVALDYPYDGPEKVKGVIPVVRTIPLARQAFRDTPPAVSLVLDWLVEQSWVDVEQLVIVGASLGVPFAALSAARDERIRGVLLVHGAADNRLWIEAQLARRVDAKFLHRPIATIVHWLAYGPTFDTPRNIAATSPRPVLIVGARDDERTPGGQTELLFAAAGEPKWLRWTDGAHVQPGRQQIVADLLAIADSMMPFPPQSDR